MLNDDESEPDPEKSQATPWPDAFYILNALDGDPHLDSVLVAFPRLLVYARFAAHQQQRVAHVLSAYRATAPAGAPPCPVFPDVHLYFIVWDTVLDMINVICRPSPIRETGQIRRKHIKTLEHYRLGRDDFEHYDERLPGSRSAKARPVVLDSEHTEGAGAIVHGEMSGAIQVWSSGHIDAEHIYEFAGRTWDIGPASLANLQQIVEDVSAVFRAEVRQLYSEPRS